MNKTKHKPGLLWITGLSGSGKTTISKLVHKKLKKKYSNVVLLDGDNIRKKLKIDKNITFTNKYRVRIGKKYVKLCKTIIKKKRKYVIIAVMAILREVQNEYKKIKNYNDVYLDVPLSELTKRDPKDLYKKFRQKKIKNMVGLDIKFDKPKKPSLYIKWKKNLRPIDISKKILNLIENE